MSIENHLGIPSTFDTALAEDEALSEKIKALARDLIGFGKVAVGFSGGIDSTFLLAFAHSLPDVSAVGITVVNALVPKADLELARTICDELGIEHELIEVDALACAEVRDNPPNRCYHCKKLDMGALIERADELGAVACDGMNVDDADDYRPGTKATAELGMKSPLADAGFTKQDIRKAAKAMGLPNWDKPASACLASRIPYGTPLDAETLTRIGDAEEFLHSLGFPLVRVRVHGGIARIEVPADRIGDLCSDSLRESIVGRLREIGFDHVTCDMKGYRMGSLNEQLDL